MTARGPRTWGGLPPDALRRAMRLSIYDGALYALMVGFGEAYFLADAVRLGASALEQGLVTTLPLFGGGLGSLAALWALGRVRRRKGLVLGGAAGQVVVFAVLILLHATRQITPTSLIALGILQQVLGQLAGLAWNSWYGDLVPAPIRGRYFGRRSRYVYVSTLVGLLGSGLALEVAEPGAAGEVAAGAGGTGYLLIFAVAGLARAVSVALLALSPEPRYRGLPGASRTRQFLAVPRGRAAGRLLGVAATLQFLVYFAAPYFAPFMLDELHFSYVEYTAASLAAVGMKIVMLPAWGGAVDRYGARGVLSLAVVLAAVVPLPWVWAHGLLWILVAQAFSGFSWSGHEVSYFSLVLEATFKPTRPWILAAQNLGNGTAQLLGSLAGGAFLALTSRDFRLMFLVSVGLRMTIALALPVLVPPLSSRPGIGRRALLLRVIGLRPHGGLVHRPLADPPRRRPSPGGSGGDGA